MDRDFEIIRFLVDVQPVILGEWVASPNHCIAATRHGLAVLDYFGIRARPQKTQAIAANAAWVTWFDAGRPGEMPDDAWAVGIDLQDHGGGYAGHLVIIATVGERELLIDLNSGQLSRPARGMPVPPAIVLPLRVGWRERGDEVWMDDEKNVAIVHHFLPQKDWHHAPDWRRKPLYAGTVINRVKELVRPPGR